MPKTETRPAKPKFSCKNCDAKFSRWKVKCSRCQKRNSIVMKAVASDKNRRKGGNWAGSVPMAEAVHLAEIILSDSLRLNTGIQEFDRVLGGGIVPGVTVMIGGDPGIGKSTLLLQVVDSLSQSQPEGTGKCLYVTGEESAEQVKIRAERLGIRSNNILIFPETNVMAILAQMKKSRPLLTVIDSIQTLSLPGIDSADRKSVV